MSHDFTCVEYKSMAKNGLGVTCSMHETCETRTKSYSKNSEGNKPLGRPGLKWKVNIKLDLGELEWEGLEWIYQSQEMDRWRALVNTVMYTRVPSEAVNFLTV